MDRWRPLSTRHRYVVLGVVATLFSVIAVYNAVTILLGCLFTVVTTMGLALGCAVTIYSGKKYVPAIGGVTAVPYNQLNAKQASSRRSVGQSCVTSPGHVVVSHNLDLAIGELLHLVVRDYVLSWYTRLGQDRDRLQRLLGDDLWRLVEKLAGRLRTVDTVTMVTEDVFTAVTDHFRQIRLADSRADIGGKQGGGRFALHAWLHSEGREREMAVGVVEVLLAHVLTPRGVHAPHSGVVTTLLTQLLTNTLWLPLVSWLCDPDQLNQRLYAWLVRRDALAVAHRRTYSYAANYERFVDIIRACADVAHLQHIRYNIISEILHATTIQNLKRAKGLNTDRRSTPKGTTKGHLLRARNLNRYLNQLTVAKSCCEKQLSMLGGADTGTVDKPRNIPGKTVFVFSLIMEGGESRSHFLKYLAKTNEDGLLRFWTSVESMKLSHARCWHQMAAEVFQMFVARPDSVVRRVLSRATIRCMEAFMLGNLDADAFWEGQEAVRQHLEEQHYPSYILSDVYHRYISRVEVGSAGAPSGSEMSSVVRSRSSSMLSPDRGRERGGEGGGERGVTEEHSTYARQQLSQLDVKIVNKSQAVKALGRSQRRGEKMLRLENDLEDEIEALRTQRRQLELHVDRTRLWADNIGLWTAHICDTDLHNEGDKIVPVFMVAVHLSTPVGAQLPPLAPGVDQGDVHGWLISRKLSDFHTLHSKLVEIQENLKQIRLPHIGKFRIKSLDSGFLDRAKESLNYYLTTLLKDELVTQSEAVFSFLSPSPEHLKATASLPAAAPKAKFSLSGLLKSTTKSQPDTDSEDELIFGDKDGRDDSSADVTLEPLYGLIGEVFELRGVFKWLRRTLMLSVQTTFGRPLNRHLRETVDWVFSEPMLVYYIHLVRDACWPKGELAGGTAPRTAEQKIRTRLEAKAKCLQNIPDVLKILVGDDNARKGVIKVFEAIQDGRLNKHLFYVIVEKLMFEIIPELKSHQMEAEMNEDGAAASTTEHSPKSNIS